MIAKKIIIISGDPNSINSEIIYKSLKSLNKSLKKRVILISNRLMLEKQLKRLKYTLKLQEIKDISENIEFNKIGIFNLDCKFKDPFKVSRKNASNFVIKSLNLAHRLALSKKISGIINCPIDKKLLNKKKIGVTEYLTKKCKLSGDSQVMLIHNKNLSIAPLTTHIDLKDVIKQINQNLIISKIKTIQVWFKKKLGRNPKIGILGLNPHNAEYRNNSEEVKIIIPAINKLKKKGINIEGPLSPDTIFIDKYLKYDVIVGHYHDQVLSPFKALYKFNAINLTLGLKYIRVSPDHGTAINLVGKNKANALSLSMCINFIDKLRK